jgi:hypothetical protein
LVLAIHAAQHEVVHQEAALVGKVHPRLRNADPARNAFRKYRRAPSGLSA